MNSPLNNSAGNNFTVFNFNAYFFTSLHPCDLLMGESKKSQLIPFLFNVYSTVFSVKTFLSNFIS